MLFVRLVSAACNLNFMVEQEFVDPMYLSQIEIKGVESTVFKYSWSVREEMECDKYEMLKHVATVSIFVCDSL
jgi:hypothetical protein